MGKAASTHRASTGSLFPEPDCQGHWMSLFGGIRLRGGPGPFLSQLGSQKALTRNSSLL